MKIKKYAQILVAILFLALLLTVSASAKRPEQVSGFVPLSSYAPGPEFEEYDLCDPYITGHAIQPAVSPGKAIHGTVTLGPIPDPACPYETEYSGTCSFLLIPVEEFGNPESKEGKAIVLKCTGTASGLHGTFNIHFDFTYDAWYHDHP
jgi:hypothetical protein